jgi:hypothetical protein
MLALEEGVQIARREQQPVTVLLHRGPG